MPGSMKPLPVSPLYHLGPRGKIGHFNKQARITVGSGLHPAQRFMGLVIVFQIMPHSYYIKGSVNLKMLELRHFQVQPRKAGSLAAPPLVTKVDSLGVTSGLRVQ